MGESESFVDNREFGRYLRRVREDRRLSLDAVEELTSGYPDRVTKSHLSRIENGSAVPSFGKMFALSQIYGIPIAAMAERFEIDLLREARAADPIPRTTAEALAEADRLMLAGRYREGLAVVASALEALREAPADADPARLDDLRLYRVDFLAHLERYELAKIYAEELLGATPATSRQRLQALLLFVICCYRLKRFTIAQMALGQAAAEIDGVEEQPARLRAALTAVRAVVQTAVGRLAEAIDSYKEAISLYLQANEPFEVCRAQLNLAQTLILAGEPDKGLPYLRTALKHAEASGYERLRALALSHLAVVHHRREDLDASESYALRSNGIARPREYVSLVFRNCYYLRDVSIRRGDDASARAHERTLRTFLNRVDPDLPEALAFRAELEGGAR